MLLEATSLSLQVTESNWSFNMKLKARWITSRTAEWFGMLNVAHQMTQHSYFQPKLSNSTSQPSKRKSKYAPIKINQEPIHPLTQNTQNSTSFSEFGHFTTFTLIDNIIPSIMWKIMSFCTNMGYSVFTKYIKQR